MFPASHDRAGWVPLAVSWSLTVLLCGLALLIAVLLFQQLTARISAAAGATRIRAPPMVAARRPTAALRVAQSSGSESASPEDTGSESGSPEPSGTEASSEETTPGNDGSPSKDPSMGTAGTGEATDTQPPPTDNTRL